MLNAFSLVISSKEGLLLREILVYRNDFGKSQIFAAAPLPRKMQPLKRKKGKMKAIWVKNDQTSAFLTISFTTFKSSYRAHSLLIKLK